MTNRILVATDLEPTTTAVLAAAVEPFTTVASALALCHVRSEPERFLEATEREEQRPVLDDEARAQLETWASTFLPGRPRELFIEASTTPFVGILRAAKQWNADLIAVAASGATGLRRLLLGSVAEGVVRHASGNVLVARPSPQSRVVIAATDLSDPSFAAVTAAADVVRSRGGVLVVAHVIDGPATPFYASASGAAPDEQRASAASWVEHAIARTGSHGDAEVHAGSAARVISDRATARGAELVVVSSHGRTGLPRILLGSVAEAIVRSAPCSVLVVRR